MNSVVDTDKYAVVYSFCQYYNLFLEFIYFLSEQCIKIPNMIKNVYTLLNLGMLYFFLDSDVFCHLGFGGKTLR